MRSVPWGIGVVEHGSFEVEARMQDVQCPSCGEMFSVPIPPLAECPAQLDYDCEVCCRPMVIVIDAEGHAEALGADDSYSV